MTSPPDTPSASIRKPLVLVVLVAVLLVLVLVLVRVLVLVPVPVLGPLGRTRARMTPICLLAKIGSSLMHMRACSLGAF